MRKKVVLAHPCYGPLDPNIEKNLRVAMMSAAKDTDKVQGVEWVGDVSSIRQGWVGGRNQSVKDALECAPDADGIIWVDDDVLLPSTAFRRLLCYDEDFVTGVIYQKFGDFYPLIASWSGRGYGWLTKYPENVLLKVEGGGCGFGCVYTSTKMLRDIAKLPMRSDRGVPYFTEDGWFDQFPPDWFGNGDLKTAMSEDFSFCRRAAAAGYTLHVDTGLQCPHMIGPKFSTKENHDRHWEGRMNAEGTDDRSGEQSKSRARGIFTARDGDAGDRDAGHRGEPRNGSRLGLGAEALALSGGDVR